MSRIDDFLRRWLVSRTRWVHSVLFVTGAGIVFLVAPGAALELFGVAATPPTLMLARLFGAGCVNIGVMHAWNHGVTDPRVARGLLLANAVHEGLMAIVLGAATLSGVLPARAALIVAYTVWEAAWNTFAFVRVSRL